MARNKSLCTRFGLARHLHVKHTQIAGDYFQINPYSPKKTPNLRIVSYAVYEDGDSGVGLKGGL